MTINNLSSEEWRSVPGWESIYEVSSLGRVRSLDRINSIGRHYKGKVLKGTRDQSGSSIVMLRSAGRKDLWTHTYRLVAEAFIGPQPGGCEVRHLNDDRSDNRVENLAWGTRSQNNIDAIYNLKRRYKLDPEKVREIRQRHQTGEDRRLLAQAYGVTKTTIDLVIKRRLWKHVV